ncbi:hypothetical protein PM082_000335 [Marasmius tenuissimus]|nr:hypothetical protein PM082_000335 [Marasmius tenuissimus]
MISPSSFRSQSTIYSAPLAFQALVSLKINVQLSTLEAASRIKSSEKHLGRPHSTQSLLALKQPPLFKQPAMVTRTTAALTTHKSVIVDLPPLFEPIQVVSNGGSALYNSQFQVFKRTEPEFSLASAASSCQNGFESIHPSAVRWLRYRVSSGSLITNLGTEWLRGY